MDDEPKHEWVLVEVAMTSTTAENIYECTRCTATSVGTTPEASGQPVAR